MCDPAEHILGKIYGELLLVGGGVPTLALAGGVATVIAAGSAIAPIAVAPVFYGGVAIALTCAAPALIIHRVASNIIDHIDSEHQYPKTARFFKILSFAAGLAVGVGVSTGILIATTTALGISAGAGFAAIGTAALAMTVCFVAYLALRGLYNIGHALLKSRSEAVEH